MYRSQSLSSSICEISVVLLHMVLALSKAWTRHCMTSIMFCTSTTKNAAAMKLVLLPCRFAVFVAGSILIAVVLAGPANVFSNPS